MICPYNSFKNMDCSQCAARMWVKNPMRAYEYMRVCAIAYNGGTVIVSKPEPPKEADHGQEAQAD